MAVVTLGLSKDLSFNELLQDPQTFAPQDPGWVARLVALNPHLADALGAGIIPAGELKVPDEFLAQGGPLRESLLRLGVSVDAGAGDLPSSLLNHQLTSFQAIAEARWEQPRVPEPFPFSRGAGGRLSPKRDFSRFLSLPDSNDRNVLHLKGTLLDYFNTAQFGELESAHKARSGAGVKIRYAAFLPPAGAPVKGALIVVNGRGESLVKNAELYYSLRHYRQQGFAVLALDHRGQGFSGRLLEDPEKGHVEDFDHYVDDLHSFVQHMRRQLGDDVPLSIYGHSMGGTVAARYLEEHPDTFDAGVLSSPLLGLNTILMQLGGAESQTMGLNALAACDLGEPDYAPGEGPPKMLAFEANPYTRSPSRFALGQQLERAYPQTVLGGPTRQWVAAANAAALEALAKVDQIKAPLLIIRDPTDSRVDPRAQDVFRTRLRSLGVKVTLRDAPPGAGHEIGMEEDATRDQLVGFLTRTYARWSPPRKI